MSDTPPAVPADLPKDTNTAAPLSLSKKRGSLGPALLFVLGLALGGAGSHYLPQILRKDGLPTDPDSKARVVALEQRADQADGRLMALEAKIAEIAARPATPPESAPAIAPPGPDAQDLENLKTGLSGLSVALGVLQGELEKSSSATDEVRESARQGIATVVAFGQMQSVALKGRPFEAERQRLRTLVEDDAALVDLLLRLEPLAISGVAGPEDLRASWREVGKQAQTTLRQTAAQSWQDRLLVALEGLVSVRALSPKASEPLSFSAIELDLSRGDVAGALEKVAALPDPVQADLAAWRERASARRTLDETLSALAARLIGRALESKSAMEAAPPIESSAPPPAVPVQEPAPAAHTNGKGKGK